MLWKISLKKTQILLHFESTTIKDGIYSVSKASDAMKQTLLIFAWQKSLCDDVDGNDFEGFENTWTFVSEMRLILLHYDTADFRKVDDDNLKEWSESDENDRGYRIFTVAV